MTRLKETDIQHIVDMLVQYDRQSICRTGRDLIGVACNSLGIAPQTLTDIITNSSIAVVPIKSGKGIIGGFSETVAGILAHIGFKSTVTRDADVSGIAEAIESNADILMMADDHRFIALNLNTQKIVDNNTATAKGFVAGLDLMCGGIKGRHVLVLGGGIVGRLAAKTACRWGAQVSMFDSRPEIGKQAVHQLKQNHGIDIVLENSLSETIQNHPLIVDATNAAHVIDEEMITPQTFITAPGMPLGLTEKAVEKIGNRLYHDPLQTGVAVMAIESALLQGNG